MLAHGIEEFLAHGTIVRVCIFSVKVVRHRNGDSWLWRSVEKRSEGFPFVFCKWSDAAGNIGFKTKDIQSVGLDMPDRGFSGIPSAAEAEDIAAAWRHD